MASVCNKYEYLAFSGPLLTLDFYWYGFIPIHKKSLPTANTKRIITKRIITVRFLNKLIKRPGNGCFQKWSLLSEGPIKLLTYFFVNYATLFVRITRKTVCISSTTFRKVPIIFESLRIRSAWLLYNPLGHII